MLGLLCIFILYPIIRVLYVAFTQDNSLTLSHFLNFFERDLFRESLRNSLFAGLMAVIFGSLISLPLKLSPVDDLSVQEPHPLPRALLGHGSGRYQQHVLGKRHRTVNINIRAGGQWEGGLGYRATRPNLPG